MKKLLLSALLLALSASASLGAPYPGGATGGTTGQQPLNATTAVQVVSAGNTRQRSALVRNHDASISIYVGFTSGVTATTGILLKAGESITIYTTAAIFAKAASGTPTAGYLTEND